MKIEIKDKKTKIQVIPIFNSKNKIDFFNKNINIKLKEQIKKEVKDYPFFKGKENEILLIKINQIKFILLGIKNEYNLEDLRKTYSNLFKYIKSIKEKEVSIQIPNEKEDEIKSIIEGLDLTNYKFDKYLSDKKKEPELILYLNINSKFNKLLKETLIVNLNVKLTRDMVNENSDIMTPIKIEEIVKNFSSKNKLKFKSLNEKQLKKEKLNLLLAVGKGSQNPPRLIICEYNGNPNSKEKIALIGKGVTFDTGGINLKPTGYIEDMKTDMAGSATVFSTFKSAVELKIKKNLILVISSAENSISGNAFKPGDIIKSYSGKTVEITNTDAEGRLVLADAISYVQKNYKPTEIIDVATLTGAVMIALGKKLIGVMGNNDKIKTKLFEAGEKVHERIWKLPIYEEHHTALKSKFSDTKNCADRYGGALTAGAFLEKFIDNKVKWTHLDIAGAARSHSEEDYIPEFGTGRGVRLLVEYLKE